MIKPRIMSKFLDFFGETPGLPGQAGSKFGRHFGTPKVETM